MPGRTRSVALWAAGALVALVVSGCGFGAGSGTKDASVLVTGNFGAAVYARDTERHVPGAETVMSMLERHFKVTTRYGGGFVESIAGRSGSANHYDWFFYVNGIEATQGAASTAVHAGDHIWWDLHNWAAAESIPAVVGSYPEPFTTGLGGRKFPTLVNCAPGVQRACDDVGTALHRYGVKAADQLLGTGSGSDSLAVVVGSWNQIKGVIAAELISGGPRSSGVYAHFSGGAGQTLVLEDATGRPARTLRGSVGLIAATGAARLGQPTWLVTGTDPAGVLAAARAFTAAQLDGHFAVAVQGGHVIPVPLGS
jgi:hypothetical protein